MLENREWRRIKCSRMLRSRNFNLQKYKRRSLERRIHHYYLVRLGSPINLYPLIRGLYLNVENIIYMHFTERDNDMRTYNDNNNSPSFEIRSIYYITRDNNDNILFVVNWIYIQRHYTLLLYITIINSQHYK